MSNKFRKELFQRDINHLEQKIKTFEKTFKFLDKELFSSMMKAEGKNDIGNALKRKSTEKKAEIRSLKESLLSCTFFFIRDLALGLKFYQLILDPKVFKFSFQKCLRVFLNIYSIYFIQYSSKIIKVLN